MCKFKSGIVLRDERNKGGFALLMSPWTESHSDLIAMNDLRDDGKLRFARVEFSPPSYAELHLPEKYALRIDERRTPDWFDEEMKAAVADKMRGYIKSIIVTDDRKILIGGQFIVCGQAKICEVKTCAIQSVSGSASIGSVYGSARIDFVYGSASIDYVYGSASIGFVSGSASIINDKRIKP